MKPPASSLLLRKRLSWVRTLAFAVMALHGGQLVAPHLLTAMQLFADQGEESDEDLVPAQDAKLEVTEYTMLRAQERLRPPFLPRATSTRVPNARLTHRMVHAATPSLRTASVQFRDSHAVRLLI